MDDLIEALQIFRKYCKGDEHTPTHCEHDQLSVVCVKPRDVSKEDLERLDKLGFISSIDEDEDHDEDEHEEAYFLSYRFGSA